MRTDYDGIDVQCKCRELVHERMEVGGIHLLGIEEVVAVILVGPAEDGALKLKVLVFSLLKCMKTGIDLEVTG